MKRNNFDLKSFVTISITVTFCFLTIWKVIAYGETEIKDFLTIATMIYMFYFQKKEEKSNEITITEQSNNLNLSEKNEAQEHTKD